MGRFAQVDTVVPDGVQGYDRYAYASNDPIGHSDPSGHCIDGISTTLCLAAAGFAIGFGVSVALQVATPVLSGESNLSTAFSQVNWKQALVYGVAGAVTGATYGAINPAETIAGAAVAGGVSGLLGGQAGALASASIDAAGEVAGSAHPLEAVADGLSNEGMGEFFQDAHEAGFLDPQQMVYDTASGALLGGAGQAMQTALTLPRGGQYLTASARAANTIIPQNVVPAFKSLSDVEKEALQQTSDQWFQRNYRR